MDASYLRGAAVFFPIWLVSFASLKLYCLCVWILSMTFNFTIRTIQHDLPTRTIFAFKNSKKMKGAPISRLGFLRAWTGFSFSRLLIQVLRMVIADFYLGPGSVSFINHTHNTRTINQSSNVFIPLVMGNQCTHLPC